MALLEVVTDGHPALKKNCRKVKKMTDELRELAQNMGETMLASNGIGLAANQVASTYRIITVYDEDEESNFRVYVNPRIVKMSDELEYSDEGCLSFPMILGEVARSEVVEVAAQDINMKKVRLRAEKLFARVFQHEIDHLNGINFLERAEEGTIREIVPEEAVPEDEGAEAGHSGDTPAKESGGTSVENEDEDAVGLAAGPEESGPAAKTGPKDA